MIAGFELIVDSLQRAQVGEQFLRVGEGLFLGRFEPAERAQVLHPGGFQGQDHLGQVQALDLGEFLLRTMRVLLLRPEPPAQARRSAAGAPGALVGRGAADLLDQQGVDAAIRIVARNARQAAVDHTPDAVNGQRGLGDVGGDDDLALIVAGHGGVLVARRQFAVQREQDEAAGLVATPDGLDRLGNLEAARHEDQHVALAARADKVAERLRRLVPDRALVEVAGRGREFDLDRERAPLRFEHAAGLEVLLQRRGVERRRHDQDLEVGPFGLLQIQRAGQRDVAVKVAFVELVEDEGRRRRAASGPGPSAAAARLR